jgi:hypothetical protein
MDRRAGILRNIRRQWSPHRVYSQIYQDRVIVDDPADRRATQVELLDRYYFLLSDPGTVQQADTYANPYFGTPSYESHRVYRLFRDLDNVNEIGERIWDGTKLFVSGWTVTSLWYTETTGTPPPVFDEAFVLTRAGATLNARYSLTNRGLPSRPPYVGHDIVTLATVETATGGWRGATDLRVSPSDRVDAANDEFVVYVWRGWGGERFRYPVAPNPAVF